MTDRRALLKTSTAASVLALSPNILKAQGTADQIKVGLIGCGGRGSGAATQALAADPGVVLWAMADVFPRSVEQALKRMGRFGKQVQVTPERQFSGLDAYQKLIDSGVDVVLLGTPPAFRPQHLRAAIEAGKHVFAEKPMAVDMHGVHSVMESAKLAKQKNLSIQHGFCWRFHPGTREAYSRVLGGELGRVVSLYSTYMANPVKPLSENAPPAGMSTLEWQIRNWFNFEWLSSGPLVEQCVHSVDKIAWGMGDIDPVAAVGTGGRAQKNDASNIYDHYNIAYEYPNGVMAHIGQRQWIKSHTEVKDRVLCEKGTMYAPGRCSIKDASGKSVWRSRPQKGQEQNMYQVCHNEFFAALRAGDTINTGEYMARSTALGLFGREAAHSGQRLLWKDFWKTGQDLAPDFTDLNSDFPVPPIPVPGTHQVS